MTRYSLFHFEPLPWWGELYCVGSPLEEKPMVLLPKPICWLLRLGRDIYIRYLEFVLWLKYRSPIQWGHK